jgi:hypothetical protein
VFISPLSSSIANHALAETSIEDFDIDLDLCDDIIGGSGLTIPEDGDILQDESDPGASSLPATSDEVSGKSYHLIYLIIISSHHHPTMVLLWCCLVLVDTSHCYLAPILTLTFSLSYTILILQYILNSSIVCLLLIVANGIYQKI